ncbi:MAG: hypothetical protein ACRC2T_09395 [Thermoguttaceae bacterium]
MSSRFGLKFTVLALAGTLFSSSFLPNATAATAGQSARWKSPKIEVANLEVPQQDVYVTEASVAPGVTPAVSKQVSQVNTAVFQRAVEEPKTTNGAIRQVQFTQRESDVSRVDRNYPESRPKFGNDTVTTPAVPGNQPLSSDEFDNFNDRLNAFESRNDNAVDGETDISTIQGRNGLEVVIDCPAESGILKPIKDIETDIRIRDTSFMPKECGLGGDTAYPIRDWNRICFTWKASGLCHKPLYFEEEALEQYGHTHVREEFQPIVSAAKFFLTIPILPYKMGLNPPNECIYSLGHYRPGDCVPYMLDPLPLSLRAGLIQAGATVGAVAIFP